MVFIISYIKGKSTKEKKQVFHTILRLKISGHDKSMFAALLVPVAISNNIYRRLYVSNERALIMLSISKIHSSLWSFDFTVSCSSSYDADRQSFPVL